MEVASATMSVLLLATFSLSANPGTVGAPAVPAKSPANWIFPLLLTSASAIVALAKEESTYDLTAFCVGNKTSLVPKVVVVDLLATSSFKFKAVCVAVDTGLFASEVLSTLPKPKLVRAPASVVDPVPPLVIGRKPVIFAGVTLPSAKSAVTKVPSKILAEVIELSATPALALCIST